MTEKVFLMKMRRVPHSSVVGSSLEISMDGVGVVALLAIMVPQPRLDYKAVASAVADALMQHGTSRGNIALVLPGDFALGTAGKHKET